jgi:hypothetical protein
VREPVPRWGSHTGVADEPADPGRIDPATGAYTPYEHGSPTPAVPEPVELIVWVDPDTATHEARHVAMGLLQGARITEARADTPTPDAAGHVLLPSSTPTRVKAQLNLAGQMAKRAGRPIGRHLRGRAATNASSPSTWTNSVTTKLTMTAWSPT